jgi:pyruvate dehydrogenase E1 component
MAMVVQPTARARSTAATSPPTPRRPRCTRSASTTSGARRAKHGGDLVFFQGHSSPGIYARAFLEGRLSEEQLKHFRQEVTGRAVVLSPSLADAGFLAVPDRVDGPRADDGDLPGALHALSGAPRHPEPPQDRKVWCFIGDGETDEPESLGAITMPVREKLDNLIFVINCNLQRLDGPVRGNGKIIQELEAAFRGAGWNVIKVVWGSRWDPLLARTHGALRRAMEECVDGEYQNSSRRAAPTRASISSALPRAEGHGGEHVRRRDLAAEPRRPRSDQGLRRLRRRVRTRDADGHPREDGQGLRHGRGRRRPEHHPPAEEARRGRPAAFRDRFGIPISDEDIAELPFYRPADDSEEIRYLKERRERSAAICRRGARSSRAAAEVPPSTEIFKSSARGSGEREISTTMALRAHAHLAARTRTSAAHRADRAGRGAHLRHGGHVPPVRHLFVGRPALHAAGCRSADVLPRGQEGPDPGGRHQRGRRVLLVAGRRTAYRTTACR